MISLCVSESSSQDFKHITPSTLHPLLPPMQHLFPTHNRIFLLFLPHINLIQKMAPNWTSIQDDSWPGFPTSTDHTNHSWRPVTKDRKILATWTEDHYHCNILMSLMIIQYRLTSLYDMGNEKEQGTDYKAACQVFFWINYIDMDKERHSILVQKVRECFGYWKELNKGHWLNSIWKPVADEQEPIQGLY